jgi:hypothetical protein
MAFLLFAGFKDTPKSTPFYALLPGKNNFQPGWRFVRLQGEMPFYYLISIP